MENGRGSEDSDTPSNEGHSGDSVLESRRRELKSLELLLLEKEINSEKSKLEQKIAARKKELIASDGTEESTQDAMIRQWLSKLEMLESQLKDELQQGEESQTVSPEESDADSDSTGTPQEKSARSRIQVFADYLKKKGAVRVSVAAKELGWKKSSIETYASVLEHKGYIVIKRPFLREPKLVYHKRQAPAKAHPAAEKQASSKETKPPTKGKPVAGAKMLAPNSEEAFHRILSALEHDFFGVMRMYGSTDDKQFAAGLLVVDGDIRGASLEELTTNTVWQGDEAIEGIRHNLSGTRGTLELYQFPLTDKGAVLDKNKASKLSESIALSDFGLTIRGNLAKWAAAQKSFLSGGNLSLKTIVGPWTTAQAREDSGGLDSTTSASSSTLKFKEHFDLASFARKVSQTPARAPPTSKPLAGKTGQPETKETPFLAVEKSASGGKKVRTKLDRMLLLIQKKGLVKMSTLVKELSAPEAKIEEWGRILENGGLITVDIPLMGDPEFRKV